MTGLFNQGFTVAAAKIRDEHGKYYYRVFAWKDEPDPAIDLMVLHEQAGAGQSL